MIYVKNKANKLVVFTILLTIMSCTVVFADRIDYNNICNDDRILNLMQMLGWIINLLKIIVPLIIIVLGMIDFGKAVIASDDKATSKAASSLVKRFIAGIVIFFIPTIVFTILNSTKISNENDQSGDFVRCTQCLLHPNDDICVSGN